MPMMSIKKGQTVFVVVNDSIYEGNISWFLGEKKVQIILDTMALISNTVVRTYGVDLFITYEEASRFLPSSIRAGNVPAKKQTEEQRKRELEWIDKKLEREEQLEKDRKLRARMNNRMAEASLPQKQKFCEEETIIVKKRTCESCGLPVGNFGHCGCS